MHVRLLALALPLLARGWVQPRGAALRRQPSAGAAAPLRLSAAPADSGDALLDSLLAAARGEDRMAVEEAFDGVPHASMVRVHRLAAEGVSEAVWVVKCMEDVMRERMAGGAAKLRALLDAGEITRMDAALTRLVREGGADTGFNLVLTSNLEHARASGDETMLKLYTHLVTRMQEELEKRAEPAMGLLHRLLRTDDAELRGRVLVDFLVPKSSVSVPGSSEPVLLATPAPAKVTVAAFGGAIADAVAALSSVELGGGAAAQSVEDCRLVAKQAREVVALHCMPAELDAFSEQLMPVCERRACARVRPPLSPRAIGPAWAHRPRLPHRVRVCVAARRAPQSPLSNNASEGPTASHECAVKGFRRMVDQLSRWQCRCCSAG